jgi:hypothetical protein
MPSDARPDRPWPLGGGHPRLRPERPALPPVGRRAVGHTRRRRGQDRHHPPPAEAHGPGAESRSIRASRSPTPTRPAATASPARARPARSSTSGMWPTGAGCSAPSTKRRCFASSICGRLRTPSVGRAAGRGVGVLRAVLAEYTGPALTSQEFEERFSSGSAARRRFPSPRCTRGSVWRTAWPTGRFPVARGRARGGDGRLPLPQQPPRLRHDRMRDQRLTSPASPWFA